MPVIKLFIIVMTGANFQSGSCRGSSRPMRIAEKRTTPKINISKMLCTTIFDKKTRIGLVVEKQNKECPFKITNF
jgi:hypothetical protein